MTAPRATLEAWFEPTWAGGWTLTRLIWVIAAALAHLPRYRGIGDVYGSPDAILISRTYRLNEWMFVTETHAWTAWIIGSAGLLAVAWGGRMLWPGLLAWGGGAWFLLASEAYNVKAYDRLLTYIALALLLSPAWRRGLARTWASPFARYVLLIVFVAIYGSTGMCKFLYEPSWTSDGQVLALHLLSFTFGLKPVGIIVSGLPWLVAPLAWFTVAFELLFPFLIWLRRTNPLILIAGVAFHLGLLVLMDVGPFGLVSISAYPVLLHPEIARNLWSRCERSIGAHAPALLRWIAPD